MLSKQAAFKLGFITQCVEKGLSISEMREQVKAAGPNLKNKVLRVRKHLERCCRHLELVGSML